MSETVPVPGDAVKLTKFPPNRAMMDWDRVLCIGQVGQVVKTYFDGKQSMLFHVWFTTRNKQEGYEVWLDAEHFTYTKEKCNDE